MDYAKPTIVGRTQSARNNVHALRIPDDGSGMVTKSLGNLFGSVSNAVNVGVKYAKTQEDEKNEATYAQAIIDFENDWSARVADIQENNPGNAVLLVSDLFTELQAKYNNGELTGKYLQNFQIATQKTRNATLRQARTIQTKHNSSVKEQAYKTTLDYNNKLYTSTGDMEVIQGSLEANDLYWRSLNKYGLLPNEDLASFDENIKDGYFDVPARVDSNGTQIPSKRYRISDDGAEGTISKATLEQMRNELAFRSKQYELGKQSIIDNMHASFIDALIKDKRGHEAFEYLTAVQAGDNPMSKRAYDTTVEIVNKVIDADNLRNGVESQIHTLTLEYSTIENQNGRYTTPDYDRALNELFNQALDSGDEKLIKEVGSQIRMVRQVCQNNFKADLGVATDELIKRGAFEVGNIQSAIASIAAKGDKMTLVDKALLASLQSQQRTYEAKSNTHNGKASKADIAWLKDIQEKGVIYTQYMQGKGASVRVDGTTYDLTDEQAFKNFCTVLGHAPANEQELQQLHAQFTSGISTSVTQATDILVDVMNKLAGFGDDSDKHFTAEAVLAMTPQLVNSLIEFKEGGKFVDENQAKEQMTKWAYALLRAKPEKVVPFWIDVDKDPLKYFKKGTDGVWALYDDKGNVVRSYEKFTEYFYSKETMERLAHIRRSLYSSVRGVAYNPNDILVTKPDEEEIAYDLGLTETDDGFTNKEKVEADKQRKQEADKRRKQADEQAASTLRKLEEMPLTAHLMNPLSYGVPFN